MEPPEGLAGSSEDRVGLNRSGKAEKAPALAEKRERLLGDDPEPLPAIGKTAGLGAAARQRERAMAQHISTTRAQIDMEFVDQEQV